MEVWFTVALLLTTLCSAPDAVSALGNACPTHTNGPACVGDTDCKWCGNKLTSMSGIVGPGTISVTGTDITGTDTGFTITTNANDFLVIPSTSAVYQVASVTDLVTATATTGHGDIVDQPYLMVEAEFEEITVTNTEATCSNSCFASARAGMRLVIDGAMATISFVSTQGAVTLDEDLGSVGPVQWGLWTCPDNQDGFAFIGSGTITSSGEFFQGTNTFFLEELGHSGFIIANYDVHTVIKLVSDGNVELSLDPSPISTLPFVIVYQQTTCISNGRCVKDISTNFVTLSVAGTTLTPLSDDENEAFRSQIEVGNRITCGASTAFVTEVYPAQLTAETDVVCPDGIVSVVEVAASGTVDVAASDMITANAMTAFLDEVEVSDSITIYDGGTPETRTVIAIIAVDQLQVSPAFTITVSDKPFFVTRPSCTGVIGAVDVHTILSPVTVSGEVGTGRHAHYRIPLRHPNTDIFVRVTSDSDNVRLVATYNAVADVDTATYESVTTNAWTLLLKSSEDSVSCSVEGDHTTCGSYYVSVYGDNDARYLGGSSQYEIAFYEDVHYSAFTVADSTSHYWYNGMSWYSAKGQEMSPSTSNSLRMTRSDGATFDETTAAWFGPPMYLGGGFTAEFDVAISNLHPISCGSGGTYCSGAEGFAFVVTGNFDAMLGQTEKLHGCGGSGIGYGNANLASGLCEDGIPRSVAIEFDTRYQKDNVDVRKVQVNVWDTAAYVDEVTGTHVAIMTDGDNPNSAIHSESQLLATNNVADLADGLDHSISVRYFHSTNLVGNGLLVVSVDGQTVLSQGIDLGCTGQCILNEAGMGWVGFTAATGDAHSALQELKTFRLCLRPSCE